MLGMARTKQILFRVEPELGEQIEARAAERGLSVNEWMNRAITAALALQTRSMTVTTKTTVEF